MKTYELTYIIPSNINSPEVDDMRKNIESLIQGKEGIILKSERVEPQTLSYPIKKQSSGYIAIIEFQVSEEKIEEIRQNLSKESRILRHMIVVKKQMKELKEKRSKRTLSKLQPDGIMEYQLNKNIEEKKKTEKVEIEEIEKKLDEILN